MRTVNPRLLVVDGDLRYAEWLRRHLGVLCPEAVISVLNAKEFAVRADSIDRDECDLLLLVASFGSSPEDPTSAGLERLRQFRARSTPPAVIAIAEDGNELTAVRAIQLGAFDYLPKRLLTPERLNTCVKLALRRVERRNARRMAKLNQTLSASERPMDAVDELGPAAPIEADSIPGYTIGMLLGESEKAVVHRATSHALGRDVALKIARSERSEGQLLAREYAAVSNLRHGAIVQIYDYGTHAGREYLAMELFPRGDLKSRLQQGVTEQDALRYIERIAVALRVVHAAGILHRDLKPPNVMVRDDDEVALIDFGLARNLEGGLQSTHTGVLRGSPYYMSPEQALGEELDPRTDIYSLGVIFYEMLTARKPFVGSSAIEVLQEHVNSPVPLLPSSLSHHQPLLARLLAKSRNDRFANVDELLAALNEPTNAAQEQTTAA